jgi:hypothetical protein
VLWAGFLILVFGGRLFTTDIAAQYQVAESMLGARPLFTAECGWLVSGLRSDSYIPHGLGFSLALVPAAGAGLLFGEAAGKVAGAATGALASLALLLSLEALGRGFFGRIDHRRLVPVMLGCMGLIYGRMPYDVTSASALALWGAVFMHRRSFAAAGLFLGAAMLVRGDAALFLPVYWLGPGERKGYISFLAALIPMVLVIFAYNLYRFGGVLRSGHEQDPAISINPGSIGIVGLLFSPGKGLLWYAPMWVAAAVSCRNYRLWLPFALSLLFHGFLADWTGGTGWGPRFLFPYLPLLFLPLLQPGAGGRAFTILAWLSLVISLAAGITDTNSLEQRLGPDDFHTAGRQAVIWSVSRSPLFNTLAAPGRNGPDTLGYRAGGVPGALLQTGVGLGVIIAGVFIIGKRKEAV